MRKKEVRLSEHNYRALRSNESMFLVIGTPSDKLAERISHKLSALTVGDVAKQNGLPRHKAKLYLEQAYPNATSRGMKQAIQESYDAIRSGEIVIVPDYDARGNIQFDHICQACANNDGNRSCKLFDRVFVALADDQSPLFI